MDLVGRKIDKLMPQLKSFAILFGFKYKEKIG